MTNKAIGTEDAIKRLVQETDAHWEKHGNNINPRSKPQARRTIFAELVKCSDEQIFLNVNVSTFSISNVGYSEKNLQK